MTNILVLCRSKAAIQNLDALFEYSKLFSLQFHICSNSEETLAHFMQCRPRLFITYFNEDLDTNINDLNFLQQLSPSAPVIVLSKRTDENTAVIAYQNGAISFVRLPCGSREFHCRLVALMKILKLNYEKKDTDTIKIANLLLSLKSNQVILNNEHVPLTNTEYKILLVLAQNLNAIVTSEQLYHILWNTSCLANTSRTLSMHISNLRHKLGFSKFTDLNIITIHKKGFSLQLNEEISKNNVISVQTEADYE